ncbi:MAG: type I 3-dehydroquinate dehydratase [Eggerthellales bacterium]|nr:type I 3-dehydroquinate dehydratase [Eggerthellales bacterium]
MGAIEIKGMKLGEGAPKTIISIMGADADECLSIIEEGKAAGVECFEWRGDFNDDRYEPEKMVELGRKVSAALPEHPLLFTFRSVSQGGNDTLTVPQYVALNKAIIEAEILDIVDIETWIGDEAVLELVKCAHEHGVYALVSYHNFAGTPSKEWMVNLMTHMLDMGADIPKCAVMAKDAADALKLLAATEEVRRLHTDGPTLTMAMGREGSITRLAGEYFGSDITFCSLAKSSAPGQVDVRLARKIMDELHSILA